MKVSRDKLKAALKDVGSVIKPRTPLPILETVKLETVSGMLEITATDLYSRITRKIECNGELAGFCVSHKKVEQLVASSKADEIEISKNGRAIFEIPDRCELPTLKAGEFPPASFKLTRALGVAPEILAEAIERVSWLQTKKEAPTVLEQAVGVYCNATSLEAFAFSGNGAAVYSTKSIQADAQFLLPKELAGALLLELKSANCIVSLSENEIKTTSDTGETSIRLLEGKGANYQPFLEQSRKLSYAPISRDLLQSACESILAIAGSTTVEAAWIKMKSEGERMSLKYDASPGKFVCLLPFKGELDITIDASKLAPVLKHVGPEPKIASFNRALYLVDGDLTVILAGALEK